MPSSCRQRHLARGGHEVLLDPAHALSPLGAVTSITRQRERPSKSKQRSPPVRGRRPRRSASPALRTCPSAAVASRAGRASAGRVASSPAIAPSDPSSPRKLVCGPQHLERRQHGLGGGLRVVRAGRRAELLSRRRAADLRRTGARRAARATSLDHGAPARRASPSLFSGGMREWPNRAVSKTVVRPAYRGFESHSLRHAEETGTWLPPARRVMCEQPVRTASDWGFR